MTSLFAKQNNLSIYHVPHYNDSLMISFGHSSHKSSLVALDDDDDKDLACVSFLKYADTHCLEGPTRTITFTTNTAKGSKCGTYCTVGLRKWIVVMEFFGRLVCVCVCVCVLCVCVFPLGEFWLTHTFTYCFF